MRQTDIQRKIKYSHPFCEHVCTSNCRRVGCNCKCGEYHGELDEDELKEIEDEITENSESIY